VILQYLLHGVTFLLTAMKFLGMVAPNDNDSLSQSSGGGGVYQRWLAAYEDNR
jgi:hypothetical protein